MRNKNRREDFLREHALLHRESRKLNILSLVGMVALLAMMVGAKAAFDPVRPPQQTPQPQQQPEQKPQPQSQPEPQPQPEQKPQPQEPQTKSEPPPPPPPAPAAKATPPAQPTGDDAASKEKETERFVPSQKTSADNSATFPVDI